MLIILLGTRNRTPLVKVVEVKFLVSFLIRHLSRTHIGRTDERKWQQLEREKENGL